MDYKIQSDIPVAPSIENLLYIKIRELKTKDTRKIVDILNITNDYMWGALTGGPIKYKCSVLFDDNTTGYSWLTPYYILDNFPKWRTHPNMKKYVE